MFKSLFSIQHLKIILLCISPLCHAFPVHHQQTDIQNIIHNLQIQGSLRISQRLDQISKLWLNRPYSLYCLGEGPQGEFDQHPLFRTDAFDCETYVDTVLALAFAKNYKDFQQKINQIRYQNGIVAFEHRNHFTNVDWNHHNRQQGFIKDITSQIQYHHHPLAVHLSTTIQKQQWYQKMSADRIYLPQASRTQQSDKLQKLRKLIPSPPHEISQLDYIPIQRLFDSKGQPISSIFQQIPHGCILEMVTPHFHTAKSIGTDLDIAHLGFVFHQQGQVYFRHASSTAHKVVELPLAQYLKRLLNHPNIKGIHLESVQELKH